MSEGRDRCRLGDALRDRLPAEPTPVIAFCSRHYAALAFAVLGLAAFNLTFRLGSEVVTEWDESLYAITAAEIVRSGNWIATTFLAWISTDHHFHNAPDGERVGSRSPTGAADHRHWLSAPVVLCEWCAVTVNRTGLPRDRMRWVPRPRRRAGS